MQALTKLLIVKTGVNMKTFILGLMVTMAGVGGVENSVENSELFSAVAVSLLGLTLMYVSTNIMKHDA